MNIILALLLAFLGWEAFALGIFFNALFLFILAMVPIRIGTILWRIFHGSLERGLWKHPLAVEMRHHWLQVFNGWLFWLLAALTLQVCIVPAQFTPQEYANIHLLILGGIATLALFELLPAKRLQIPTNLVFLAGSVFMGIQIACIYWPMPHTDGVALSAPFRGEWLVVQGGRSSLINHHYGLTSQRHALDIERLVNSQEKSGSRQKQESWFSWGQTLYAPADGKVVKVVNTLDDNAIGKTDEQNVAGNYISIDLGHERFAILAHLQKGSVLVSAGEIVRSGQAIAKCGNSGNTSQPHLHLQVQDRPDLFAPDVRTYPILFQNAKGLRNGEMLATPFFVRRNDHIQIN